MKGSASRMAGGPGLLITLLVLLGVSIGVMYV
jgi:hypothetical protein